MPWRHKIFCEMFDPLDACGISQGCARTENRGRAIGMTRSTVKVEAAAAGNGVIDACQRQAVGRLMVHGL
jgi:hypothetical protein